MGFVPNEKYTEESPMCKVYRMNLFAKNKVVARSRFWYFMGRLCRVKKANGQIISVNQMYDKNPEVVKNFGFWLRYESRTHTQCVQGVPRDEVDRRCQHALSGHGWTQPCEG